MNKTVTLVKCKGCQTVLEEPDTLDVDECPKCGATGGRMGSWWSYL